MTHRSFAGSNGLMDVPAPEWIEQDEALFSQWGLFLLAMIKHGIVETVQRNESLHLEHGEFGLLIDGGLFAVCRNSGSEGRDLLVQFLKRGDMITSAIGAKLPLSLTTPCKTNCLIVRQSAIQAFKAEFPLWDRAIPLLHALMAQAYSQALCETLGRDQDRIHRVLAMMAAHPTAINSTQGREIEAGKQQIRDLAGVQKRSASRAFRALEDAGYVNFHGYKRLYYKESQE